MAHYLKIKARGHYIKSLYDLTRGKEGEAEYQALKKGIKQVQNLVNKRIKKLKAFESETGITSPALQQLRETGRGAGISAKGDIDTMRETYKAAYDFVKQDTSTIPGIKENVDEILSDLHKVGYRGKKLTNYQYNKFKNLAKKFYSETSKYALYRASGGRVSQAELRAHMNKEIAKLLNKGGLNTVLTMAEKRINEIQATKRT